MNRTELRQVSVTSLTNGGYSARLMQADRLVGDRVHGLPPGKPIMAVPIHCLPGSPEGWVRDPGTYVVEVDAQHGLWFDWCENDKYNVAIVPTVKGMNPITGLKTDDVAMHQYREECPKHKIPFAHDYFCEECGYKWPAQNYVSHPNILWWDGFRQPDGSVRQFFFSEEDQRDVASAIIGKKNTIPAFGFAFYRCKNERRPKMNTQIRSMGAITLNDCAPPSLDYYDYAPKMKGVVYGSSSSSSSSSSVSSSSKGTVHAYNCNVMNFLDDDLGSAGAESTKGLTDSMVSPIRKSQSYAGRIGSSVGASNQKFEEEKAAERAIKDVSVGAGARINQSLEIDQTPLEEWGKNPESVITLYFVFSEQMEEIINKGGIKKLESKPEGYLENVIVG